MNKFKIKDIPDNFEYQYKEENQNPCLDKPCPSRFWAFIGGMIFVAIIYLLGFFFFIKDYTFIHNDWWDSHQCYCQSDLKSFLNK